MRPLDLPAAWLSTLLVREPHERESRRPVTSLARTAADQKKPGHLDQNPPVLGRRRRGHLREIGPFFVDFHVWPAGCSILGPMVPREAATAREAANGSSLNRSVLIAGADPALRRRLFQTLAAGGAERKIEHTPIRPDLSHLV